MIHSIPHYLCMLVTLALAALPLSSATLVSNEGQSCCMHTPIDLFQYKIQVNKVPNEKFPDGQPVDAYLWLPEDAKSLRGLLVGGSILMEADFVIDPEIREACRDASLGIVYFTPHLDAVFDREERASDRLLEQVLQELSQASNHPEIKEAPLMPFGHSVASIFVINVLKWQPERCFAVLTYKGSFGLSTDDDLKSFKGIPALHIQGQFEEFGSGEWGKFLDHETRETGWKKARENMLALRAKEPELLAGLLVEDGSTHMPWTGRLSREVAEFIRSAAALRLPGNPGQPLRKVESSEGVTLDEKFDPSKETATFWYPSKVMAQAIEARFDRQQTAQPQFVSFAHENGKPYHVGHDMRMKIKKFNWIDHDTFKVSATFLDQPSKRYPALPETQKKAGHAEGEIQFQAFGRSLQQVGPNLFRNLYNPRATKASIFAFHAGDDSFRYTEQPAFFRIRNPKDGTTQSITFNNTPKHNLSTADFPYQLKATASSGLPVGYWVDYGPATVDRQGQLHLAEIPTKATYPITIKIVAYQMGSQIDNIAPAEPVTLTISYTK